MDLKTLWRRKDQEPRIKNLVRTRKLEAKGPRENVRGSKSISTHPAGKFSI